MRVLTVDRGNTRRKAAVWEDGRMVGHRLARADIGIYCSVAGGLSPDIKKYATEWIILDSHTPLPLDIDYDTPETLGADRIAAAVGARYNFGFHNMLVVDVGTAVTIDVVQGRRYCGGNIMPGLDMQLKAMHEFTARLPKVKSDVLNDRFFGRSTHDAMLKGALVDIAAAIEYSRLRAGKKCKIILTGGDAPKILQFMTSSFITAPDLTLQGLCKIAHYNLKR